MTDAAIDAVITWVDGQDKKHSEKLADYLKKKGITRTASAAPTRFNQCGELDYCVHSLLHFAPWLRTIYIVTDEQTPAIMKKIAGTAYANKIKLIDHKEIFQGFEQFLPSFNSLAIESVLWRIKGLSEHFIYLNDDCMMLRPVGPEDFFREKRVILRGEWKVPTEKSWLFALKKYLKQVFSIPTKRNDHRQLQENSAKLAGWSKQFFHLPHAPFAVNKTTLADFFNHYPELLEQNLAHALRHRQQFWPLSLAQHLEIKNKNGIIDNKLKTIYIHASCHSFDKIRTRLTQADKNDKFAFICIQSLDAASSSTQNYLLNWLGERITIS